MDDRDCPYETPADAPFDWIRAWQVGGRMTLPQHGRVYARMSPQEFEDRGPEPGWPFGPAELAPWYAEVEELLGLRSGDAPPVRPNPADLDLMQRIEARWPTLETGMARSAPPLPSMTLAHLTERMTCQTGAVVREVLTDADGATSGVAWFDRATGTVRTARSRLVFLAASALESAQIMLASRSNRHPEGLGGFSGALGRYLIDHLMVRGAGTGASLGGTLGLPAQGHCVLIPRMDQRDPDRPDELEPYSIQAYRWEQAPDRSILVAVSFAPMAPRRTNTISLHPHRRDAFGRPALRIECRPSEAERATTVRQARAIAELAEQCGVRLHHLDTAAPIPGAAVHEAGVARMGWSPDMSVLNPFNECWAARGLFVTDAACYPVLPRHAPTLTSMALTARAVAHALGERGQAAPSSNRLAKTLATATG